MKQTDYWGTAAFFTDRTRKTPQERRQGRRDPGHPGGRHGAKAKKKGDDAKPAPFGQIAIPIRKGKMVKAKFLGGEAPTLGGQQPSLRPCSSTG